MTLDELIAEGEAIARHAYLLSEKPNGDLPVACWEGVRDDMPNATPVWATALAGQRHICTVSEEILSRLDLRSARRTGPVSLFEVELATGEYKLRASGDDRKHFNDLTFTGGVPLYATPFKSFPPFAALCCHGSARVGEWLASEGYARHEYWYFGNDATEEYEQEWMRRSPFYHPGDATMIVGGWHFLWPEDDFYTPPECRLLFLTLRDAEPWYEAWLGLCSGGLRVHERIT